MKLLGLLSKEYKLDIILIVILAILALAVRIPIAAERKIMPAGDAFNFQHIASAIQYGKYPIKEKRLPSYPVFILMGRSIGLDPIRTSIGISIVASTGTILALYGLGRVFGFNRAVLVGVLGLAIFDELLVINGIRPLADGLFVFFVATTFYMTALFLRYPEYASPRLKLLYSIVITFLMFTRYEGFLIAGLTAPFLFIKLPWKEVGKMALIPTIAIILWIPAYKSIHGSVAGLSYITDATSSDGGFGELSLLPDNLNRLLNGAGWRVAWSYPQEVFEKGFSIDATYELISSPFWWMGVLSIIGLLYILAIGRSAGLTIILAGIGYALLLSWWWVYSRYVAPLSILFYFGAAGGLTLVTQTIQLLLEKFSKKVAAISFLAPLVLVPILLTEIPTMHNRAMGRAWESNRKGYSLYEAMVATAKKSGPIVYPTEEHANATLFFGQIDKPRSAANPAKGMYLSRFPKATPNELFEILAVEKPRFFIETDYDERIPNLLFLMKKHKIITKDNVYQETLWDTLDTETTHVYELNWP